MLELDRRGIPAVAVFSEEFETAFESWTKLHGFRAGSVFVNHPIQPLDDDEVRKRADDAFEAIVGALTAL